MTGYDRTTTQRRRTPSTAFKPGHPKLGGRAKGQPNHATIEVRKAARKLMEDVNYRRALARRLHSGRLAPTMETTLWHYLYGEPKDRVEVSTVEGGMLRVIPIVPPSIS